jgi:hypothetical protein
MDDNDLYFEAMKNMELEARDNIGSEAFHNEAFDNEEVDSEDLEDHVDPALFYLACQKALIRLKTFAASNPSF